MIERLTSTQKIQSAFGQIAALIRSQGEWLCVNEPAGRPTLHRRHEIELTHTRSRLLLSGWSDRGNAVWRIMAWEWTGGRLVFHVSRRVDREQSVIELIPRITTAEIDSAIRETRMSECLRLARLFCSRFAGAKVERASLSPGARRGQPGRYARIILRFNRERVLVTAPVIELDPSSAGRFVTSALLWFSRTSARCRNPVRQFCMAIHPALASHLVSYTGMLRESLWQQTELFLISEDAVDPVGRRSVEELWEEEPRRLSRPSLLIPSRMSHEIIQLCPAAIDCVRSRGGETLRFRGLPFARVRNHMGQERAWFGLEGGKRTPVNDSTIEAFAAFVEELQLHRRADARDRRHSLYKALAESWLESILRRDIRQLDPGLIVAPLYAQFRTGEPPGDASRPVDLLALRTDGRLVVIELKVAEDREHVMQGIDYWRRVEAHRRSGAIARARLFDDREIADCPALVYLVAPALRFHRSFSTLARMIHPAIEIYRFDINEDWRSGVRVTRRIRVN